MILWSFDSKRQFLYYLNNKKEGITSRFLRKMKISIPCNHDLAIPRFDRLLILIFFLQKEKFKFQKKNHVSRMIFLSLILIPSEIEKTIFKVKQKL